MMIESARIGDKESIAALDCHIPPARLVECIAQGRVYVLRGDSCGGNGRVLGILRYSLFWQTIPFLDMLYLDAACRGQGNGRAMMQAWEAQMKRDGFRYVMTSTQADEDAWRFYEKLGYRRLGGFLPPEQEAEEWIFGKNLEEKA